METAVAPPGFAEVTEDELRTAALNDEKIRLNSGHEVSSYRRAATLVNVVVSNASPAVANHTDRWVQLEIG